jgi:hypothetical protein
MHYASNFLAVYPDIQTDPHILYIRHHQTKKNIRLHGFRSELRCATCAQHLAAFKVKPWNWGKHETTGISQTFKWDLKGYSQM